MSRALTIFPPRSSAQPSAWLLAVAGTLPFLGGLADSALRGGEWLGIVRIYAALTVSFVCGIHWGAALFIPERIATRLLVTSNASALLAWLAALLPHRPGYLPGGALFAALLAVDRQMWRSGLSPAWCRHLRAAITGVAVSKCLRIGGTA
ncbi:DUF3429 domain-containing protein [Ancylobacter terrae]|uniref:DUF3429 domain-containing protein n=1 Tax=Ancylobacter sp. sgz301288 TaxID=3342077 RepID=UPI00385BA4BD